MRDSRLRKRKLRLLTMKSLTITKLACPEPAVLYILAFYAASNADIRMINRYNLFTMWLLAIVASSNADIGMINRYNLFTILVALGQFISHL
jgi:hypothetical protein